MPPETIALPSGVIEYDYVSGNKTKIIVFINGIAGTFAIWDRNFNFFANQGYSLLRYNYFGRGLSKSSNFPYNMDAHVNQLYELLTALIPNKSKVTLVGMSLGTVIGASFTVKYPQLVENLIFVSPIGFQPYSPKLPKILNYPKLSWVIIRPLGKLIVKSNFFQSFHSKRLSISFMKKIRRWNIDRNCIFSMYSELLYIIPNDFTECYEKLNQFPIPKTFFLAENDFLLKNELETHINQILPECTINVLKNCGHMVQYESSSVFNILMTLLIEQ